MSSSDKGVHQDVNQGVPRALYERELQLEEAAITGGIQRYRKRLERGDLSSLPAGKTLYRSCIEQYAEAVSNFVVGVLEGKARRKAPAALLLAESNTQPLVAAAIAARRIINGMSTNGGEGVASLAISIGALIEEAVQWEQFTHEEPKLARHLEKKISKMTTERYRRACMRHVQRQRKDKTGQQTADWTKKQKLDVGLKLIEIFQDVTGYIEIVKSPGKFRGRSKPARVVPTETIVKALSDMHTRAELASPMYLPMVVEPQDWTTPFDGGYIHRAIKRRPMVRTRGYDLLEEIANVEMPEVYSAINAVQKTGWRINYGVLSVLERVLKEGHAIAGIPSAHPIPMPERPHDIPKNVPFAELSADDQERIADYRRRAQQAAAEEATRRSRWIMVQTQREAASMFKDDEVIFFPHYLDFRGRMYPLPTGLSPQGNDLGRALLEFSEGLALGDSGGYWLAVQVANMWGQDKLPLDDRVKWTVEHTDLIVDSAFRPLEGQMFWLDADKPWCALAAAFEWAGFQIMGDEYVSHLPIAMDGSCSGLQHYSALLRDEVGGRAVNLTNDGVRHDIYAEVAATVESVLNTCQGEDAEVWRGRVSRSIVKRPVMTYAYSVTPAGMRDQILQEVQKGGVLPEGIDPWPATMFLSNLVHDALRSTVVAASNAMEWLKETARLVTDTGLPIQWTSPCGLPVIQRSWATSGRQADVMYGGQRVRLWYNEELDRLDKRAQASGVAPNFIHSMDAAHLMRTVNALAREGVQHFAMIHDSFGTHAANTDLLNLVLREEFVRMYQEEDWLAKFALAQQTIAKVETPPLPPRGSLRLEEVIDSEFFFS